MSQKPVIITADSCADLPPHIREEFQIHFFPLYVILEGRTCKDCVDIFPQEIYDAFKLRGSLPKTAAPSIVEYKEFFEQFTSQGAAVVHVSLCNKYSSVYHVATLAAEEVDGEVHIVDSMNFCTGSGMVCMQGVKLRDEGRSAQEIAEKLTELRSKVRGMYYLDGLTFLSKSGRCPSIVSVGAALFNLHPSITMNGSNGEIVIGKQYRGKTTVAAERWLRDSIERFWQDCDPSLAFFMHTPEMPIEQYGPMDRIAEEGLQGVGRLVMDTVGCLVVSHVGGDCYCLVGIER